jgi:AcrB/AcrD/AcrF family
MLIGKEIRGPIDVVRVFAPVPHRFVLMTTAAAMLAGVPMMFGRGTGSELRRPLGFSMVGGLALSQVLTLYTTPVVYLYLARLQTWIQGRKLDRSKPAAEPQAAAATHPGARQAPDGLRRRRLAALPRPLRGLFRERATRR